MFTDSTAEIAENAEIRYLFSALSASSAVKSVIVTCLALCLVLFHPPDFLV